MDAVKGLTEQEARMRREHGEGNEVQFATSRSYADIARANILNLFNAILITIGGLLIALGRVSDALISIGPLFLANAGIRTAQEIYTKRKLDQIAIASRPTVTVIRDGGENTISPAEMVRGDILRVRSGDQIMADGTMVGAGWLELDESLLSGESELVSKRTGDSLLSGSVCVSGDGLYRADKVGSESFANQLTVAARKFESVKTPLQRQIDVTVRVVILVVALISLIILISAIIEGLPLVRLVQISAVLTANIPYGLFFVTIIAYALGAVVIARRGAVAQEAGAIESLSGIDVLCMDKTGTLTANRLSYSGVFPLGGRSQQEVEQLLGRFAVSASSMNRTSEAIAAGLAGEKQVPLDEVAFTSARKWSALAFERDEHGRGGVYVLGALDALQPYLPADALAPGAALMARVRTWAGEGLRVMIFACNSDVTTVHEDDRPELPSLIPVAVVAIGDELRPEAQETIAEFAQLGIEVKIISGDDPHTVAALAKRAGLDGTIESVSGSDLERMSDDEFAETADRATIFGRTSPRQKERLVEALIGKGHRVAMIGDGVNDVLAVKKAQLGIAMQSGSSATRNVADMVLLDDSFSALRPAFQQGKRIIAGVAYAMCLFLTRVAVAALVIVAISVLGLGFPFEPAHVALTYLTAGVPSFFLILWAKPEVANKDLLWSLTRFVIPAATVTTLFGVALYTGFYMRVLTGIQTYDIPPNVITRFREFAGVTGGLDRDLAIAAATIVAQTVLSVFITITAFLLILFLIPPVRFFAGWTDLSKDKRPAFMALGLFAVLLAILVTPSVSHYFALFPLGFGPAGAIGVSAVLWVLALRFIWRARLFERLLA
ncbi:MAG: HAD-IC family P-type ATPase, partial [bacterium]